MDKPGSNNWQLNINRPGELYQVYGLDICVIKNDIIKRYVYGLGKYQHQKVLIPQE